MDTPSKFKSQRERLRSLAGEVTEVRRFEVECPHCGDGSTARLGRRVRVIQRSGAWEMGTITTVWPNGIDGRGTSWVNVRLDTGVNQQVPETWLRAIPEEEDSGSE
jgi:hypothetical protein